MALDTGRSKLFNSMKKLRLQWEAVQEVWNDPVSKEFEENYFLPLDAQVQSTLRATDRLSQILIKLRQECS